ncbi:hypothetical protein M0P25_03845 [archaeon]|nr:hypothetical protein [archaeon]MCK9439412.1 hypothetical protein [Patescibacteria group bacterium]
MKINEEVLKNMDEAALIAENELNMIPLEHIKSISIWWKKNYLKAGHKRLAKLLLAHS